MKLKKFNETIPHQRPDGGYKEENLGKSFQFRSVIYSRHHPLHRSFRVNMHVFYLTPLFFSFRLQRCCASSQIEAENYSLKPMLQSFVDADERTAGPVGDREGVSTGCT